MYFVSGSLQKYQLWIFRDSSRTLYLILKRYDILFPLVFTHLVTVDGNLWLKDSRLPFLSPLSILDTLLWNYGVSHCRKVFVKQSVHVLVPVSKVMNTILHLVHETNWFQGTVQLFCLGLQTFDDQPRSLLSCTGFWIL